MLSDKHYKKNCHTRLFFIVFFFVPFKIVESQEMFEAYLTPTNYEQAFKSCLANSKTLPVIKEKTEITIFKKFLQTFTQEEKDKNAKDKISEKNFAFYDEKDLTFDEKTK